MTATTKATATATADPYGMTNQKGNGNSRSLRDDKPKSNNNGKDNNGGDQKG